jgi:hypothetical protein
MNQMSIQKEYQLIETSFIFYLRAKQNMFAFADAFKKFRELFDTNRVTSTPEAESLYLKHMLSSPPSEEAWKMLQEKMADTMNARWTIEKKQSLFQGLQTLKFTDVEIFSKMAFSEEHTISEMSTIWDNVKVYLTRVSQDMSYKQISFNEARKTTMKSVLASNEQYIRKLVADSNDFVINSYISKECLIQMYLHARAHNWLWGNGWVSQGREEDETLRKLAILQTQYQDKESLFLKADYGLRDLNLTSIDCLKILEQNIDIDKIKMLNANIALMPAKISAVKEAINSSVALTFEEAAAPVLAGSSLSIDQFKQLLSPANQIALKLVKPFISSTAAATSSPREDYLTSLTSAVEAASELTYEQATTIAPAVMPVIAQTSSAAKTVVEELKSANSGRMALPYHPNIRLIMSGTELTTLEQAGIIGAFVALLLAIVRPRCITVPAANSYNYVSRLFSKSKTKLDPAESVEEGQKLLRARYGLRRGSGSTSE